MSMQFDPQADTMEILRSIGAVYSLNEEERKTKSWCRLTSMRLSPFYINIGGKMDRSPAIMDLLAQRMADKVKAQNIPCDLTVGVEKGSIRLSSHVGLRLGVDSIYLEKEIAGAKAAETELIFGRHSVQAGEKDVIITEDLITKGTTIQKIINALGKYDVNIRAIVLPLNRSGKTELAGIPIISLVDIEPYDLSEEEFRAQFPEASISEKPKDNWEELMSSLS